MHLLGMLKSIVSGRFLSAHLKEVIKVFKCYCKTGLSLHAEDVSFLIAYSLILTTVNSS